MSYRISGIRALQSIGLITALVVAQVVSVVPAFAAGSYVTLDSFSGTPGSSIVVSGGGFTANDTVNVYFSNTSATPAGVATADNSGSFGTSVSIPSSAPQGPLSVIAIDSHGEQSTNSYYVIPLSPTISTQASSHAPFAVVTITGTNFAPNETVTVALAGTSTTAVANASGAINGSIVVPMVSAGLYNLTVTGNSSHASALDYFYIDAFYPSTAPSTYYVVPSQTLSFNGSGFAPSETVSVTEGNSPAVLSTFTTDASGSFTDAGTFKVPSSFKGATHTFVLTGASSHATASTGVTVGDFYAAVSPSAYWLLPGAALSFNGSGFAANETISVFQGSNSTPITTLTANATGGFTNLPSLTAPYESANGTASYTFIGSDSGASATASVTIGSFYPSISPSEYYVEPNATITVTGTGFAAGETVTLTSDTASSTQTTADTNGAISAPVKITYNTSGSATITATGAMSKSPVSVGVTLATFYPSITPSTYYAFPGDTISFTGTGFAPDETVTMTSFGTTTTVTTDDFGTFTTGTMTIPVTAENSVSFNFTGAISNTTVTSAIGLGTLSPYLNADTYSAAPGQTVTVTGFGFSSGETVHVTAGSFATDTPVDSLRNTLPVAVPVPYNAHGSLIITLTGNSTGATASLTIPVSAFYVSLTADNYYTAPGSTVTFTGTGFAPNEQVAITSGTTALSTSSANTIGTVSAPFTLPFTSAPTTSVTFTGISSGATATVDITMAPFSSAVSPSTYYTAPGSAVTFTGTGFVSGESVNVALNGTSLGSVTASSTGNFTYTTSIPLSNKTADFTFTGSQSGAVVPISITLSQFYSSIMLDTYYAQGGAPLTINGSGFGANEAVSIVSGSQNLGSTTADSHGAFTYSAKVPFAMPGSATITATGNETGTVATSPITIAPTYTNLQLGSYAGAPGTAVTFIGSGYIANEPITITTDRTGSDSVYTFKADNSGNFHDSGYILPGDFTEGNLVLTATGAYSYSSQSITYYVTGK